MNRLVRRLLVAGASAGGLWTLKRVLSERAERRAGGTWPSDGPADARPATPAPGTGVHVPAPARAQVADIAATPSPEASSDGNTSEKADLDGVKKRLASIHVDVPPARPMTPPSGSSGASSVTRGNAERWVEPAEDGTCAPSHPIKAKLRSRLFHLPGMIAYDRTRADRCYRTAADAEQDGFSRAKR